MRFLGCISSLLMTYGVLLSAPARGEPSSASSMSVYSTIFTILNTRDFLDTLEGPFTIFIPTNAALAQLSPATLRELSLPENAENLSRLVANHVVKKQILRGDFEKFNNREIKSLSGRNLTLKSERNVLTIDGAHILRVEPAGEDGVIYVIDRVLTDSSR